MENDSKILSVDFECTACKRAQASAGRIPVGRIIDKLDSFFDKNDNESARRHLDFWRAEAVSLGDESGELSVVNEQLGLARKLCDEQMAQDATSRAQELIVLTGMEKSVPGATIMLNAATTCKAFGRHAEALELYRKAAEIYSSELEMGDLRFAALFNNQATALSDLERYDEALSLYTKAIELTQGQTESLTDCAITYVNMAHLYENRDGADCPLSVECLDKAWELLDCSDIRRDSYYAFVCDKCAPAYDYFGFFLRASELRERARRIYEGT